MFKHLVISGGSVWGFYAYGAIREAYKTGYIQKGNLKSIYGTSVGALIGAFLCLGMDFEMIDDYLIRRPWRQVLQQSTHNLFTMYQSRGIIDGSFFNTFFEPMFKSVDFDLSLTMKQLYDHSGIDLHMYTLELNEFVQQDISHRTHPDWRVVDAVRASCSLPMIFCPLVQENKCWIDGAVKCNYPVKDAKKQIIEEYGETEIDAILGISLGNIAKSSKNANTNTNTNTNTTINTDADAFTDDACVETEKKVDEKSSYIDFATVLFIQIFKHSMFYNDIGLLPNEIMFYEMEIGYDIIMAIASNQEERRKLVEEGGSKFREQYCITRQNPVDLSLNINSGLNVEESPVLDVASSL